MKIRSSFIGEAPSAYMVAASPRTGSSWLCDLLTSLGNAGRPVEYAREIDEKMWRAACGFDSHVAYFWSLPAWCSTPNGVLGIKLLWSQFAPLLTDIRRYTIIREETPDQALASWLGDSFYIWIRRRDRVRQAVSFARAFQTNRWASTEAGNGNTPVYCREDIERSMARVVAEDEGWAQYFARYNIQPMVVWYEDLTEDTEEILKRITGRLGLEYSRSWRSRLERQSDSLTDEWVMKFAESSPPEPRAIAPSAYR